MPYINSFNHYRALAIVLIVAAHSRTMADLGSSTFINKFIINGIAGATMNFTFISGFLFYIVIYKRFEYSVYVKNKFNQLLKPYLVLSVIPIVISILTLPNFWDHSFTLSILGHHPFVSGSISVLKYLVSGAHVIAYWYIPFALLMALMSPLHIAFIKLLNHKWQIIIFLVFLIIASIVHRPHTRSDVFQSVHTLIYFTPSFLFGIVCAIHREKIYAKLKGKEVYLLAAAIFFILLQLYFGDVGLYSKSDIFSYNGFDLLAFKMVFLCLFLMVWLHRFEHIKNTWITILANTSFAIFFLHVYILRGITLTRSYFKIEFENYNLLIYVIMITFITLLSALIAVIVNKILPKYSLVLVGYGKKKKRLMTN
ncbi:acyltransferase family protein [Winogradskyella schleiferi]|uniref:acyltransferase family protein n=1 Tax=Winogradskyella schleiferi TaxID=2686078 RepID=UPI0015BD4DD0|nr:acyltransferase [Winogradskyella schleiferi]